MIALGPDLALWFTEQNVGQIGRITTSGVVTEYKLPSGIWGPTGITAGPDGAMWFTAANPGSGEPTGVIGRIDTAGVITTYPAAYGNGPIAIMTGADSALWYTGSTYIARYCPTVAACTPAGVTTSYPITSAPVAITRALWIKDFPTLWAADESGNVWQAEFGWSPSAPNQLQQMAPIQLGTSGSNANTTCCGTGTLGSLVQDSSGNAYILSNNHVLADSNTANMGDPIIQTGFEDAAESCTAAGTITVANLSNGCHWCRMA